MKKYTVEEIRNWLKTKDSLGDAMYYLSTEDIDKSLEIDGRIEDITLVQTCGACPEQYDAFLDDKEIGYLRLRHGHFTVSYPGWGGEIVYDANPEGDGIFEEHEREGYLNEAKRALLKRHLNR